MSLLGFIVFDNNLPDTPAMLAENNAFTGANSHACVETFTNQINVETIQFDTADLHVYLEIQQI